MLASTGVVRWGRMELRRLHPADLPAARSLLTRVLIYDRVETVAEEKLFGADGVRTGRAFGAFEGATLLGVAAAAGRWVKLLAVAPEAERRGVGSALYEALRAQPSFRLRLCDHPGNYLSPGLDVRYHKGHGFAKRRGLVPLAEVENLRAPLVGNALVSEERMTALDQTARDHGYTLGRATGTDREPLLRFVKSAFAEVWAHEVGRALDGPLGAVHLARRGAEVVAFAAADGNNQGLGWFGPAGTLPEHRGRRLGEALLLRCLLDVRGLPEGGVIAWIGPKGFYARACGAVEDRRFVAYQEPEPT